MIIASLLAAVVATAAATPSPNVETYSDAADGGGQMTVTRTRDGHRVTIIAGMAGRTSQAPVLTYRDAAGRDVRVFSDSAVSREEADRLLAEARAEGVRGREEARRGQEEARRGREEARRGLEEGRRSLARARIDAERAHAEGDRARAEGERARAEGERARAQGLREADAALRAAQDEFDRQR